MSVKIAIAEDDPAVRKTFVQLLEALGYQVVCAVADGNQLVDGCIVGEVDLAFADFHMPVMDGLAAAELIAARGIPVVLVSGHPDAEDIVLAHEPVVCLVRKPATAETIVNLIDRTVIHRRTVDPEPVEPRLW